MVRYNNNNVGRRRNVYFRIELMQQRHNNNKMRMWIMLLLLLVYITTTVVVVNAQQQQQPFFEPVRINCGGKDFIDSTTGFLWKSDLPYLHNNNNTNMMVKSVAVCGWLDFIFDPLKQMYCTHRLQYEQPSSTVASSSPPFEYRIPVLPPTSANSNSSYVVRLHFAEMVGLRRKCHTISFVFVRYCSCYFIILPC
jgi:hypothetical protein